MTVVQHPEASLQRDFDPILSKLNVLATLVEEDLMRDIRALSERDRQLAYSVIMRDQQIDGHEKDIDRLCLEFIVNQQPVAQARRFAYSIIKVNAALERIGDCAENVARQILALCALDVAVPHERFNEIAQKVVSILAEAVEAFVTQDPERARRAMRAEEEVERLRLQFATILAKIPQSNELDVNALGPLLTIMNRFERTADQAKDICQEVLHLCTGQYLEHQGNEVVRVLFVDDDNACASQMAEAIGTSFERSQFVFSSAGLERKPVDVGAIEYLEERGMDISSRTSKTFDQVPLLEHYQLIVALSPDARRVFPPAPTRRVSLDWSAVHSVALPNTAERTSSDYQRLYELLSDHVRDLVEAVASDRPE